MATHSQGQGRARIVCYLDSAQSRALDDLWRKSGVRSRNQYLQAVLADAIATGAIVKERAAEIIREPRPRHGKGKDVKP